MNYKEPIREFFAVTYDNNVYHFIIDNEKPQIYCCEFGLEYGAKIIEIKPNFVLRNERYRTVYSLNAYLRENPNKFEYNINDRLEKQQTKLIKTFIIESSVFEFLVKNNMITYSHDMAVLYNFDTKYAFDAHCKTNAFKKQRKDKTKILSKQKQGIFN